MPWQPEPPCWTRDTPEAEAVFDLLAHYLKQTSSVYASLITADSAPLPSSRTATTTAEKLNDLFTATTTSDTTDLLSQDASHRFLLWRSLLRYFFATVFHILAQTPPESPIQHDLVDLLVAIRTTPSPDDPPPEFYDMGGPTDFWDDLPTWRSVWADFERQAPLPPRSATLGGVPLSSAARPAPPWPERSLSGLEWANLNAFLAKLHTRAAGLTFVDICGLFALIDALEDDHPAQILDDLVPAAARWILEAGWALKENKINYPIHGREDGSRRLPWSRGVLWLGLAGFNAARWRFWCVRFGEVSERWDVLAETRELAGQAAVRMKMLEEAYISDVDQGQ